MIPGRIIKIKFKSPFRAPLSKKGGGNSRSLSKVDPLCDLQWLKMSPLYTLNLHAGKATDGSLPRIRNSSQVPRNLEWPTADLDHQSLVRIFMFF